MGHSKKHLVILGVVFFVVIAALLLAFFNESRSPHASAAVLGALASLEDQEYRNHFTSKIAEIDALVGIGGMVDLVIEAFEAGRISMFECHSLGHDLGHYGGYPDNYAHIEDFLSKRNLDFCGSGFMHGIEGQLANMAYPQNAESLYAFCNTAMPLEPFYYGCYHGAGHAFMENTRDPLLALSECDTLIVDDNFAPDVSNCYRGVFSEHSDYLHEAGKSKAEILQFCTDLPVSFQGHCAEELNGLHVTPAATDAEMEEALRLCGEGGYSDVVAYGCMKSVSGVVADTLLGKDRAVVPPLWIHAFSTHAQKGFIDGTIGALLKNGTPAALGHLDRFCEHFEDEELQEYCTSRDSL